MKIMWCLIAASVHSGLAVLGQGGLNLLPIRTAGLFCRCGGPKLTLSGD